jgi:hypothetical protein
MKTAEPPLRKVVRRNPCKAAHLIRDTLECGHTDVWWAGILSDVRHCYECLREVPAAPGTVPRFSRVHLAPAEDGP